MSLRKTLLAATMLALPLAAQAQPVTGLYVAGALGANWHDRIADPLPLPGPPAGPAVNNASMSASTSIGFVGLVGLGWGFGNGLRLEVEGNYRNNDVDAVTLRTFDNLSNPVWNRRGYISTMGIMANVMYDIGSTMGWPVHLTLGAGVGYAWNRLSGVGGTVSGFADNVSISGTTGGFAYQGIAGLTYPIRAVPGLALTLEYRYFASQTGSVSGTYVQGNGSLPPVRTMATSISPDNTNNSVLLGVRYNFGQARPAAPVAAAPAPARSFLVFFDFASDQLTARAREIVNQAAQAARSQQVTRIEVAGHTDTVGSAQYNQGLSIRRANNVAAELVRLGVPRQAITTAGFGFSRPLVPTGPNVREPQNRRVEIVLR